VGQAYNFTAPGCTPQDMLAELRFALARGVRNQARAIGVDDQAMFSNYDQSHETRIAAAPAVFRQLPASEQLRIGARLPAQVKPELTPSAIQSLIDPPDPRDMRLESATTLILGDGYLILPPPYDGAARQDMGSTSGAFCGQSTVCTTWAIAPACTRTVRGSAGDTCRPCAIC
jgi:hypothetical protein